MKSTTEIETRLEALEATSPPEGDVIRIKHVSWDHPTWYETLTLAEYRLKYGRDPEPFSVDWAPLPESTSPPISEVKYE
jgi:hypothetical protein